MIRPAIVLLLVLAASCQLFSMPVHVESGLEFRLTHRRYVSHILFENRAGLEYITILMAHGPNYHAFKDIPHALHYPCGNASDCLKTARKLDAHLRSGQILSLRLTGSVITEIRYLNADS